MILIDIQVFNKRREEFQIFECIVDTGATFCVVEKTIAEELGLFSLEILHLWQMGEALNIPKTRMKIRYKGEVYLVEGLIVEIRESYKRPILAKEKCTRPESPHPLTNRIIIGQSFLDKLSPPEYRKLFS